MWVVKIIAFLLALHFNHGCQMEGVSTWFVPVVTEVVDVQRGIFFSRSTTDILRVDSITYGEGLNGGPYVTAEYNDSVFTLSTNNVYPDYEENEVSSSMTFTIVFGCSSGSTATLVFQVGVIDTNNNAPQTSSHQFTLTPPLPPGFEITGCLGDIIARDIDLTTRRVDFEIEDNPYFEIEYDEDSTVAQSKQFKASLKTSTLIRSIPEPIQLTISATDVDDTGDPPITTYSTITIEANDEFQLPEEPVFAKPYYLGTYSDNGVELEVISLQQGYHESVQFTLEGDFAPNFGLSIDGNGLSVTILSPVNEIGVTQIVLVISAEREYTSGATTTVILQLPQATPLAFEQVNYVSTIIDNVLSPLQLVLSEGNLENGLNISLSEYSSFFSTALQGNVITLTMTPLDQDIINENSFLSLLVTVSNDHSTTTAVVTLDIVKYDVMTPTFEKAIYTGQYDTETGLTLEQIILAQGYDDTVSFLLDGDHVSFFGFDQSGPNLTITVTSFPSDILSGKHILLTILAVKPRTVGANAAITIDLPIARNLEFESNINIGSIQEELLTLDPIVLSSGFDSDVQFRLEGDYAIYFNASNVQNVVTLTLTSTIPANILTDNDYITLTLFASGDFTTTTSTSTAVLLNILKEDSITPVFSQNIYVGVYSENNLDIDNITLAQGHDDTVTFRLDGENSQYFNLNVENSDLILELQSEIPSQLIFDEKVLIFNIIAEKPLSVSTSAAIAITFSNYLTEPTLVSFENNAYVGSLDGSEFNLEDIILNTGYTAETELILRGDLVEYFNITNDDNVVRISLSNTIPADVLGDNKYVLLELDAQRNRTVSIPASIIINVVDQEGDTLAFEEAYYEGTYSEELGLQFNHNMSLSNGYDDTVIFALEDGYSNLFQLNENSNTISISLTESIQDEVLRENNYLMFTIVAYKTGSVPAKAAIVIDLLDEVSSSEFLSFSQVYYKGTLEENQITLEEIRLETSYNTATNVTLTGEYSEYFQLTGENGIFAVELISNISGVTDNLMIFILEAQNGADISNATLIIELVNLTNETTTMKFEKSFYIGKIENDVATIEPITLIEGYSENVNFNLTGELANHFGFTIEDDKVLINLLMSIPVEQQPDNGIIILDLEALAPGAISAHTAVIFELDQNVTDSTEQLLFAEAYYKGNYSEVDGLDFSDTIILAAGYDDTVEFGLDGENSIYFTLFVQNESVTLTQSSSIPSAVLANNPYLIFTITAEKPNSVTARTTVVITLTEELTEEKVLGFNRISYTGSIDNNIASLEPIVLSEGYENNVTLVLNGELSDYFSVSQEYEIVLISLQDSMTQEILDAHSVIVLELQASAQETKSAFATIAFEVIKDELDIEPLQFSASYYIGNYSDVEGLDFSGTITLAAGYDDTVEFGLDGENSIYFSVLVQNNSVTLTQSSSIPSAVLVSNPYLIFTITAEKPNSVTARTTIVITLTGEITGGRTLGFNRISYAGSIENKIASLEPIVLSEGYAADVTFALIGELSNYFRFSQESETILISLQDTISQEILDTHSVIVLELQASAPETMSAFATIVFEVIKEQLETGALEFSEPYYTGSYNRLEGLVFDGVITLSQGYDQSVEYHLDGENTEIFILNVNGNSVTLSLNGTSVPENIINTYLKLIFVIFAEKPNVQPARATIVISILNDEESNTGASFEKILYQGLIEASVVQHESILVSGYSSTTVDIVGEYTELFSANVSAGSVNVYWVGSVTLPEDVNYVLLELRVDSTSAVLVLDVIHADTPTPTIPTVSFSSPSYILRVDVTQTGKIGQVEATADSGEQVTYSLRVEDDHLLQRMYIDEEGAVHLSAPAYSGVYTFQVTATTIFTQVTGVAQVHLTVDAITSCGQYDHVVPPLLIIDRDEEEPHRDLVTLSEEHQGCWFNMSNRWPVDQTWLYVDETGLHTTAIDREHESIAFMALSQVQVELVLVCDTDDPNEALNSRNEVVNPINIQQRQDYLGPYDYGSNKWVITDTILFNPRRTFVNLIVNDINDNYPIFEGKENEPIVVGYPISELEERVIPRALIQLKATDADVGENASLVYWTSEEVLAVYRTTGLVHVRDVSTLTNGSILTVHATDRDGEGLTGSLDILVKLLDVSHIAVVTVRGAVLDDEETILSDLSSAVGYEVKALRSTVIADSVAELTAIRKKRQTTTPTVTIQIYIYGLIGEEPVNVDRLAADITDSELSTVNLVSTLSLEDHLSNVEICSTSTGLLVATIVLSSLLFILIVAAAVYFILLWRKKQNYDQFSDENSLASRNESLEAPKPNPVVKPRLNIEELRRSERRLQEMLDAPIQADINNTSPKPKEVPPETVNISIPEQPTAIVIQSIDKLKDGGDSEDDDEFGERLKAKRKSVVTFNENVEKIIHVANDSDNDSNDYEVYKF